MSGEYHTPVLFDEVLRSLISDVDGVYVDGTLGGGGHAEGICKQLSPSGRLVCFDADEDAIRFASERLREFSGRLIFVHSNFRNIKQELARLEVALIQGLRLDLGISSFQIDVEEKGFSFRGDERIDMRMDRRQILSGWDVVNRYDATQLSDVVWKYGEERNSRRISRKIIDARPIDTTKQLAAIVESAVGKQFLTKTLARVFQAIRIEVNDELRSLEKTLVDSLELMAPRSRIVVISYHSLEDRIVKTFFKTAAQTAIPSGHKYIPDTVIMPKLQILTKSPVTATAQEIARNPRARSAKMRVAEKISCLEEK